MSCFENKQEITKISFAKKLHDFCPMGNDWYTNNISVIMEPGEVIPDYIEVEEDMNLWDKKELIIEDVVAGIYHDIMSKYNPIYLKVSSRVEDAVHIPVVVEKESK